MSSQGKSQGKNFIFKVRELSGNFEICQGILEFKQKSGKSQGILLYSNCGHPLSG